MDNFLPKRKRLRLENYDYTKNGAYFFTICLKIREPLLSKVVQISDSHVQTVLSPLGEIVTQTWNNLPKHNPGITLGPFVVMPDHIHGILLLDDRGNPDNSPPALPELMRQLKSFSSREINRIRCTPGVSLWQRGYFEHIIRDQIDFDTRAEYILTNPIRWAEKELLVEP